MREVPATTVVTVPREHFSTAPLSLSRLLDHTRAPRRLVYVDGGSPRRWRRELEQLAIEHDFTLVRTDCFLTPNEARNLAFDFVDTEFVAFVDQDVLVSKGWLDALESCAEDTGATVVGPLYGWVRGDPAAARVHTVGGESRILEEDGRRVHRERHYHEGEDIEFLASHLDRHETELAEFHCLLARADVLRHEAALDEGLRTLHEHIDLCLAVREAGGTVWIEPTAIATYVTPRRLTPSDLRFWILRWNDTWNDDSLRRFVAKWALDPSDPMADRMRRYCARRRWLGYAPYRSPVGRLSLRVLHRTPRPFPDRILQPIVRRREEARRARATPRVVHAASWSRAPLAP